MIIEKKRKRIGNKRNRNGQRKSGEKAIRRERAKREGADGGR